jgi:hypothetical protein
MGRTACTEPQCLYKGALYLFFIRFQSRPDHHLPQQVLLLFLILDYNITKTVRLIFSKFLRSSWNTAYHKIHKEILTRFNIVTKFYFIFIWRSTCFGRHTAHHQELKTALTASGFASVDVCWTCGCWTASSNHTFNNLPRMQNQRLLVQF